MEYVGVKKTHLLRKTRYSLNDEFSGFLKFQEILQTDQDATLTTRKRSQSATLLGPLCDETFCHLIAPFNKNQPINRKIRKKKKTPLHPQPETTKTRGARSARNSSASAKSKGNSASICLNNQVGVNPKIGVKPPKMDGSYNGKPYFLRDDLGGFPMIFSETTTRWIQSVFFYIQPGCVGVIKGDRIQWGV